MSGLSVGKVGSDGTAPLTYEVGAQTGKATVSVTVSAEGSQPRTVSFDVEVLDAAAEAPASALTAPSSTSASPASAAG